MGSAIAQFNLSRDRKRNSPRQAQDHAVNSLWKPPHHEPKSRI
jgi:hypothetical protein